VSPIPSPQSSASPISAPRVTVIMIVRDGERFIEEALQSVCAQTMHAWEVLVVDDGSRDGTVDIVGQFIKRDSTRFFLLQHPAGICRGMSASRNLGLKHARGELITFLDHDDVMSAEKLDRQCKLLDQHPDVAAVIGPNIRWYSWDQSSHGADHAARVDHQQDLGIAASDAGLVVTPPSLLPIFLERTEATPQAPMVRADAIRAVGGFEEAFRDMYEDQVFLAKLLLTNSIVVSNESWQCYRQHSESCVHRAHREGRHQRARRRFLAWLDAYILDRLAQTDRDDARHEMLQSIRALIRRAWWKSLATSVRAALRVRFRRRPRVRA